MITNDRQYRIVNTQIENFQNSLEGFSMQIEHVKDVHPKILEAERNAMKYQLQLLLDQAKEYEDLKEGKIVVTDVRDIKELPIILIKSRIANGYTQSELAGLLSMKEQQIQRYEAELYESVSLKTLIKIAEVLKVKITGDAEIRQEASTSEYSGAKYPFKQMFQRKWFPEFSGTYNEAVKGSELLISNLFQNAGIENKQYALNRRTYRTTSKYNQDALNAWYARVILKARDQQLSVFFNKGLVTKEWLKELVSFSVETDGPIKAVQFLRNSGIRVVFEPQLEGTYLDGAALLLDKVYPVIAMTIRYDRVDNFWFVLFHELAHIILHLGGDFDTIFDDLDSNIDGIESEADNYALDISVPAEIWKKSLVRFSPSKETIINQARLLKVHPALVAGRIRRETGKFHLFGDLVGQGEIRKMFNSEFNN